jgi:HKD family nuclease
MRATVAYATNPGVDLLFDAVAARGSPLEIWLVIGLDGGVSEPLALRRLSEAYGTNLRLFTSAAVASVFHVKAFVFDARPSRTFRIVVGSANLTGSGLGKNREGALLIGVEGGELTRLRRAWNNWWEEVWAEATPVTAALLRDYEAVFRRRRRPIVLGDRLVLGQVSEPEEPRVASALSDAEVLWIDAGQLTGGARNQLELPRSALPFFRVGRHDRVRSITLRFGGRAWQGNRLRFYPQNDMWRLNINTGIVDSVGPLRNRTVAFGRLRDDDTYTLRTLTRQERTTARTMSHRLGTLHRTASREYGWY